MDGREVFQEPATSIKSHRDLIVWQKGMLCAEEVYRLTRTFPHEELYGLTSQLRRAVTSIPANIAEGHGRGSTRDYAYFVSVAKGSVQEASTFLELSIRLEFLRRDQTLVAEQFLIELERMLGKLHSRLVERNK